MLPKIKQELENTVKKEELEELIISLVQAVIIDGVTYTKEEINNLLLSHNHDNSYITKEQLSILSDNDWGSLFEEEEGEDSDETSSV